jgi:hypothetical protein
LSPERGIVQNHPGFDPSGAPASLQRLNLFPDKFIEPSIRYKRIHTFQAYSLFRASCPPPILGHLRFAAMFYFVPDKIVSHSDTSPDLYTSLSAVLELIPYVGNERSGCMKKRQRIICLVWVPCQPDSVISLN